MPEHTLKDKYKLINDAGFKVKSILYKSFIICCKFKHDFKITDLDLKQNNFEVIKSDFNNITIRCKRRHVNKVSVTTPGQLKFSCPDCEETERFIGVFKKKIEIMNYTYINYENNFITISCSKNHIFKHNLIENYLYKPQCPLCDNKYKHKTKKPW